MRGGTAVQTGELSVETPLKRAGGVHTHTWIALPANRDSAMDPSDASHWRTVPSAPPAWVVGGWGVEVEGWRDEGLAHQRIHHIQNVGAQRGAR